jgi:ABC-type Na+ efflux pump permease subunit
MALGPILRRELVTKMRRAETFHNRAASAGLALAVVVGCVATWDLSGWDRASVRGASRFAMATFGLIVAVQAVLTMVLVPGEVAPVIASERDRKSLDALLATRLSSAEIVLGTMAAGLVRYASGLAALLPVAVAMVFLGGVDVKLVLLAAAGLASTAVALAALSAAASAVATTAGRAVARAVGMAMVWMVLPTWLVIVLPPLWPSASRWVAPVAVWLSDSSPFGVVANLAGLFRRASPVGALFRMIALQLAGAAALVAWSSWRLRPASRAAYDGEGRAARLRSLRVRRGSRPPCGDDPVLWNEVHSTRGARPSEVLAGRLLNAIWIGLLAYVASWFAVPAFAELAARGYGAPTDPLKMPDLNPLARVLVNKLGKPSLALTPGQARLEFNIVLRHATTVLDYLYILIVAGAAAEAVAVEKERDTWLGLIATPLSGREILRGKMLGAAWRARVPSLVMVGLWTVGLLSGAVHPLGFLAAMVGLVVSSWLCAAGGVYASLWSPDRKEATARVFLPLMLLPPSATVLFLPQGWASVLMAAGSMPFLSWASLLSFEDVAAASRMGAFPQLAASNIRTGEGAGRVLAAVLIGLIGQAVAAALLTRAACRGFDDAAGRPKRPPIVS